MHPNLDSKFVSSARSFSQIAGLFVLSVGLVATAGWVFGFNAFKFIGPITMKANTAISLVLIALSLLLLHLPDNKLASWLGIVIGCTIAVVGSATLSQHIFGWNLGIDELLFSEPPGAPATASPNRMGPPAATSLTFSGIALILFHRRSHRIGAAQLCSVIVFLWGMLSLLGYIYKAEQLYEIAKLTGVAMHTSICLFILGLGLLAAKVDEGFVSVIARDDAGAVMARRLIIPAIFFPFLFGWLILAGERSGHYDLGFGIALLVIAIIVLFILSIWKTARKVSAAEKSRVLTESALKTSEDRFEIAIKHAPIIVFNQDRNLRYTWIHNATDFLAKDIVGKTDRDLLDANDARILIDIKQRVLDTGIGSHEEVRVHQSETAKCYDLTVEPLRDSSNQIVGITCAAIDITEIKKIQAQLQLANQLKDEFLATVSHELRTPLNAILGWANILQNGKFDQSVTMSALKTIEQSAKNQADLINDLLDVSRITSGKLHLDVKAIRLSSVIEASIESIRHAADGKEIQINTVLDRSADSIAGDATRLQQVFWNLISNAVKFTPKGGRVDIKLERVESKAQVTVSDNGEGISPEFLPYVFDRFQQADGTITRSHGGLGLGLAIARHLVEIHGGTIHAFSDGHGKGATFSVALPLRIVALEELHTSGANKLENVNDDVLKLDASKYSGIRVLMVDDDPQAREILKVLLTKFGADIRTAASAKEAKQVLEDFPPDLIICDIGMPHEDGLSFIRTIRSLTKEKGGAVPAIALTGYARDEDRTRALEAGFQMFVSKPVKVDELLAAINFIFTPQKIRTSP